MNRLPVIMNHLPAIIDGEIIDGEIVQQMIDCDWCHGSHPVILGDVHHCCGDTHDPDICCQCGHFHDGTQCPGTPCGDYRCCRN